MSEFSIIGHGITFEITVADVPALVRMFDGAWYINFPCDYPNDGFIHLAGGRTQMAEVIKRAYLKTQLRNKRL